MSKSFLHNHLNPLQIHVEGATCVSCMRSLESLPSLLPDDVGECSFDLSHSLLKLRLLGEASLEKVLGKIRELGFKPHLIEREEESKVLQRQVLRQQLIDLGIAAALAGNIMLLSIPLYSGVDGSFRSLFETLSLFLTIPSVFYCGRSFFRNFYSSFSKKKFSIDTPILIAVLVAFFYSVYSYFFGTHELYFDSVSALVFLLLASRYYLGRLQNSHQLSLQAFRYFDQNTDKKIGEYVAAKNGILNFDGILRSGEIWVDASKFTGEPLPQRCGVGDSVFAGTEIMSQSDTAFIEVESIGQQTRIAKLLETIQFSQLQRPDIVLRSDKFAKSLLKVVLFVSVLALVYFFFYQGDVTEGIRRVLALWIVTCPCALALGTPLVFSVAMKRLLTKGILIKNPNVFEKVLKTRQIAFDKTGTLTLGKISIIDQMGSMDRPDKSVLYAMVCQSQHPVSRKIQALIFEELKSPHESVLLTALQEVTGKGLFTEDIDGNKYELVISEKDFGNYSSVAFRKNDLDLSEFIFEDTLREDSAPTIHALHQLGYQTELLSGDKEGSVKSISQQLGIGSYHSRCSPEEKARRAFGKIMVGDGLNDALALSKAEVGIAVKGGLKGAIESSEVYSLKDGVSGTLDLIHFSNSVYKTIRQNFVFSTSYNFIGAVLSLTGWMNPLFAAVLMPMSATTVFLSSLYMLNKERKS